MNDNDELPGGAMAQIEDEAGLWCARMQGENARTYQQEFDGWRATSPAHDLAYGKALKAHQQCLQISALPDYGPDRDRVRELELAKRAFRKQPFWVTTSALAASLVLGIGLGVGLYFRQIQSQRSGQETSKILMLMTRLGEIRTFHLPDGTVLTLDTQSRAEVTISDQKRHLRILSGRMRLNVANAEPPFEIDAGASHIKASQGIFDLVMEANREIAIRSLAGRAELTPLNRFDHPFTPSQAISVGQTLSLAQDRYDPTVKAVPALDAPDWPNGWVECNGMSLIALVDLANRYSSRKIVIDTPASAKIEVSGRIKIADTGKFVHNIADQFDFQTTESAQEIRLWKK